MKSFANALLVLAFTLASLTQSAWAHAPSFDSPAYSSADDAYIVDDPAVSIVLYRTVTCERPELWLALQAEVGFPLFVQLLIPRIERLAGYRPSLAIVGPGLPEIDAGIELPEGAGALVFETEQVEDPVPFDEPFTQTQDWILVEETVTLPASGTFYVTAWHPGRETGKLAVAVGTLEQFGADSLALLPEWTEQNQIFHETPDYPPPEPVEEVTCEEELDAPQPAAEEQSSDSASGCGVSQGGVKSPAAAWVWAMALPLWLRARRKRRDRRHPPRD